MARHENAPGAGFFLSHPATAPKPPDCHPNHLVRRHAAGQQQQTPGRSAANVRAPAQSLPGSSLPDLGLPGAFPETADRVTRLSAYPLCAPMAPGARRRRITAARAFRTPIGPSGPTRISSRPNSLAQHPPRSSRKRATTREGTAQSRAPSDSLPAHNNRRKGPAATKGG